MSKQHFFPRHLSELSGFFHDVASAVMHPKDGIYDMMKGTDVNPASQRENADYSGGEHSRFGY